MPNTLAHIGINGLITRSLLKKSDILWIYIGCLIPDFSWIIRKIVGFIIPGIDAYDLQVYVIIQASFFFTVILSSAFSAISNKFSKTFIILLLGSFLHLLLDPIQTKWGNGVHFFAPFSWEMINFGFFWPESYLTYLFTFAGLLFYILNWREIKIGEKFFNFSFFRISASLIILLIYFLLPLLFVNDVYKADNHFVSTLKNATERTGKYVEMDRKKITFDENSHSYFIESFDGEKIKLSNLSNISSSKLSIKGKFLENDLINVIEYHENWVIFRDGASYGGLILIASAWFLFFCSRFAK